MKPGIASPSRLVPMIVALCLAAPPAGAVQPDEVLKDGILEGRARAISAELRCLVCQNQAIDDSDAPLARDLRLLVRERLRMGDADRQVRDYVVGRYGEFVLLKPVLAWHTAVLWLGPAFLVLAAICGLAAAARSRRGKFSASDAPLSAEEEASLRRLAGGETAASR